MRLTKLTLAAAALAMAGVTHAAGAQSSTSNISFGVSGGPSFPSGDNLNSGFAVAGHLGVRSRTSPLGVRFDVLYNNWDIEGTSADTRVIGGTANLMIRLPTSSGAVRPYLSGGLGVYNTKVSVANDGSTDLGLNAGAGLDFPMSGIIPFAEVRFHSVFTEGDHVNFVPLVFGIRF